ncbi:hypothetical protein [Geomonas anaerohicana]|uniref:Cytochrome c n=1 Tax=Geomonas anaerohicana TaxID=2798583 RepID=A0ABS0YGR2_9BACT|nr:hypothetical protein [Geomonas anaerohicana]MBJ6751526.1 hypothetical protein [Geomonas anaerohicana]
MQFNPAMIGIPLLDYFNAAPIKPTGAAVSGRYLGLPPFSIKASCYLCHYDIVMNENRNRHATMSFNKLPLSQYGYGYDKERPWVSGPGKFGSWSPVYNRQLANMKATYPSQDDLLKKLDMGAFEFTTECGVCHVGGGPGTSNPYSFTFPWRVSTYKPLTNTVGDGGPGGVHSNLDNEQRNQSILYDYLFPLPLTSPYYPRRVPLNPWDFFVNSAGMVKTVDWAMWGMNGTLQMDCLMCHLDGYDHLARNEEIVRYNRLYNAGTLGSGLAVLSSAEGDTFTLDYDASKVKLGSDGILYLDFSFTDRITRYPKAENCVHCHMPTVVKGETPDWKKSFYSYDAVPSDDPANPANVKPARYLSDLVKRGDIWNNQELHQGFQCSGCHTSTGKYQAWDPSRADYQHSPGKGYDPMSGTADDFGGTVKFCYDCHVTGGDLNGDGIQEMDSFGAPQADAAHIATGLMLNIVPGARRLDATGAEATFTGNHLDVISCTACHIQKRYAAARSIDYSTGAQFFNFVGNPLDQRDGPERVDLLYSWKETTPQKTLADGKPNPAWRRLIYPFNYVTGIYWNNIGSKDANGDGFTTGMSNNGKIVSGDPFFQRNVKERFTFGVNAENNPIPVALTGTTAFDSQSVKNLDGGVMFTRPAEIAAYKAKVTLADPGFVPQLVLESEPYLVMHNVQPTISFVLGGRKKDSSGNTVYGCSDCHGASGGLFNGNVNMIGKGKGADGSVAPVSISFTNASDVVTKGTFWDKNGTKRSLSFSDTSAVPKKTREPGRWEFLGYDSARVAALNVPQDPANYGMGVDPKAYINPISDVDPIQTGTQVSIGVPVALSCPPGQYRDANGNGKYDVGEALLGQVSYAWSSSDTAAYITNATTQNATITFTTLGTKAIYLSVKDEEGKSSSTFLTVTAVMPPLNIAWDSGTKTATFSNLPSETAIVQIAWGDGLSNLLTSGVHDPLKVTHSYSSTSAKTIKIYCYSSTGKSLGFMQKTITP